MIPSIEDIMRRRHHTRRRLRFISLMLLVVGSMPLTYWAVQIAFERSGWFSFFQYGFFGWSAMFIVPAITLWFLDRPLSRRLVPLPEAICPKCGYALERLAHPRCPECGLALPDVCVRSESGSTT